MTPLGFFRRVTFKEDVQDKLKRGLTCKLTFTNTRKLIHHLKLTMMKKEDSDSENEISDKIEDFEITKRSTKLG